MKKLMSLGLAVLMAGCATPTVTPTKPVVPMPPMPGGLRPKVARTQAPMPLTSIPRTIVYTPGMTNVLTIREAFTNSVVWTNLSKTNATMGWRTNRVTTGVIVSYPTNAWNWALQFNDNLTNRWGMVRLATTSTNWRTTNGQWFEVKLSGTNGMRFYRLTRTNYSARLVWDAHPESNILSGFKVYMGLAPRTYTESRFISNLAAFDARVPDSGYGFVLTNLNVLTNYYIAVTAVDTAELESDFSDEVLLWKMTE